jgi:hypothetical protein
MSSGRQYCGARVTRAGAVGVTVRRQGRAHRGADTGGVARRHVRAEACMCMGRGFAPLALARGVAKLQSGTGTPMSEGCHGRRRKGKAKVNKGDFEPLNASGSGNLVVRPCIGEHEPHVVAVGHHGLVLV